MRRILSFCLVFVLLTLAAGPAPAAARQLDTDVSLGSAPLDLATMVLVPSDLKDRPDAAVVNGAHFTATDYSARKAIAVQAAGHLGGYETWLAAPVAGEDQTWQVAVALDEFATAKGATEGFDALTDSGRPDIGTKTIGKESKLSTYTGTNPYDKSKPDKGYTLVFRVDRIVATLYLDQYDGQQPKIAEAETLGDILAGRIDQGLAKKRDEPGLSTRTLRLDQPMKKTFQDNYYRLDGTNVFGTLYDDVPSENLSFGALYPHATDVYFTGQTVGDQPDGPTYLVRMANFSSATWAATYVKNYLSDMAVPSSTWKNVKEIADAKTFGDQSHTATFTMRAGKDAPGPTIFSTVIVARSGARMVTLRVQAFTRVPVALVEGLMEAQMRCLTASSSCAVTAVPAGMEDLRPTSDSLSAGNQAWRFVGFIPARSVSLPSA